MEGRFSPRVMGCFESDSMARPLHRPVLLEEILHFLNPAPGNIIVDATIGGAGHAEKIIQKISPGGMLIGIDRDSESLKIADERLRFLEGQFKLINKNFRELEEIIKNEGVEGVNGILFDFGTSSIQLETKERGFSIKNDGPLDMRMDRTQRLTARDLVNDLTENELSCLIRDLGEERFHRRIAKNIVSVRKKKEIQTTGELADVVSSSMPYGRGRTKIHPATRTFQALRIRVNDELSAIEEALRQTPYVLKRGARVAVVSFHSLEDRIVKNVFKEFAAKGFFRILTKKVVTAGEEEILKNPRARSAKLRAIEKL